MGAFLSTAQKHNRQKLSIIGHSLQKTWQLTGTPICIAIVMDQLMCRQEI